MKTDKSRWGRSEPGQAICADGDGLAVSVPSHISFSAWLPNYSRQMMCSGARVTRSDRRGGCFVRPLKLSTLCCISRRTQPDLPIHQVTATGTNRSCTGTAIVAVTATDLFMHRSSTAHCAAGLNPVSRARLDRGAVRRLLSRPRMTPGSYFATVFRRAGRRGI